MNRTLSAILETDKRAQEQLAKAERYRQEQIGALTEKKESLAKKAMLDAKEKAVKESEAKLKSGESLLASRARDNTKIKENMDALYKENGDKWVNEIFLKATQI